MRCVHDVFKKILAPKAFIAYLNIPRNSVLHTPVKWPVVRDFCYSITITLVVLCLKIEQFQFITRESDRLFNGFKYDRGFFMTDADSNMIFLGWLSLPFHPVINSKLFTAWSISTGINSLLFRGQNH